MILVTGGTGLVGSHLLYFLLKDGQTVRAIRRASSDFKAVKEIFSFYSETSEIGARLFRKIEWVDADITEVPSLSEAFIGITHVYHAAAFISFKNKDFAKLKKINIEGTANIVNLCLLNNIQKLVHVSSIATLGKEDNGVLISEKTQWNPENENSMYSISKYGAEMEVWRATQEGLDAVIVQPGVIFGSGHWNSGSGVLFNRVAKGISFYTPGGIGIVDVKDVVEAMILLMNDEVVSESFVLVGKNIYYKELLSEIAVSLNKKSPNKKAPKWILMTFSKFDWLLGLLLGKSRKLTKSTVNSLYRTSFYNSSKIENEFGFSFIHYKDTLARVAKNYLNSSNK
jgi:nucleoside-diphosphate-sugar epimerase|tara:strand:+ start:1780 stop:2802 length:1023 start_codon:yes stop_codon:yes gene_type:complete